MLHLTGYDISIDDLQNFRQLDSITPGHPENHVTPGVEVSTGPLGQGISNAVGLALAQARRALKHAAGALLPQKFCHTQPTYPTQPAQPNHPSLPNLPYLTYLTILPPPHTLPPLPTLPTLL
eukprot:458627-Pleurochrysis_carterae.AAC.1